MGPSSYLYAARNFRALYRFAPGGGASAALWLAFPVGTAIADIDFDQSGNAWGGGNNSNIYSIDQSKVITTFPFVGNVHSGVGVVAFRLARRAGPRRRTGPGAGRHFI